jgi:hypothetical protein
MIKKSSFLLFYLFFVCAIPGFAEKIDWFKKYGADLTFIPIEVRNYCRRQNGEEWENLTTEKKIEVLNLWHQIKLEQNEMAKKKQIALKKQQKEEEREKAKIAKAKQKADQAELMESRKKQQQYDKAIKGFQKQVREQQKLLEKLKKENK